MSAQALPFDVVHAHLREFVCRTLAGAGVRGPAVEDVAQEVFVLLHRKGGAFVDLRAARSWLYAAARRLASNHLRSSRRDEAREPGWSPSEPTDIEAQVEARSTLGRVARAASRLDPAAASAFAMVELQGRRPKDAASALGLQLNTTRSHVQRVRIRLRRALMLCVAVIATVSALLTGTCATPSTVAGRSDDSVRPRSDARARPADAEHLRSPRRDGYRDRRSPLVALWSGARHRSA